MTPSGLLVLAQASMGVLPRRRLARRGSFRHGVLRVAAAFVVLVGLEFVGYPAQAQDAAAYLEYAVDPGCPSRSTFIDQVRVRSPRARFADEPGNLWIFKIEATVENGRASGKMSSRRGSDAGIPRTVYADSCADVVSALALITAVAIDTQRSAPLSAPEAPARARVPAAAVGPSRVTEPAPIATTSSARDAPHSMMMGAHASGATWPGSTPVFLAGASAFLDGALQPDPIWAPAFRLSFELATSPAVRPAMGAAAARFTLMSGRLDACPMRWPIGRDSWIRPCLAFQGGRLTGTGLPDPQLSITARARGPWLAVGQFLRLCAGLGGGWVFELQAGIAEPIVRDAFVFRDPDIDVVRVPQIVPTLEAGIGFQLR